MQNPNVQQAPADTRPEPQDPDAALLALIEADLADMPFREPVVDDHVPAAPGDEPGERLERAQEHARTSDALDESIDRQWLTVTEAARRAILADPEARHAAAAFTALPLSEELPRRAIGDIAARDPRTARLARKAGRLGALLELETVPDELITPDITHSPRLMRREEQARGLVTWRKRDNDLYRDMLDDTRNKLEERPGISDAERKLVARRYRYARDMKTLGLMAELQDHPMPSEVTIKDGLVRHELPSGTRLVMTGAAFENEPALLDPGKWESRRQIKDRVYAVQAGGRSYIMKERKTPLHTDTTQGGYRETLTSEQEFQAAQDFAGMGSVRHGDIVLRWEKPLGYVEFSDGYQFCLFESEPELPADHWPKYELARAIENVPEEYREEYEEIRREAKRIYAERRDLFWDLQWEPEPVKRPRGPALSRKARARKAAYEEQQNRDELTFEEFAELKANYMIWDAMELFNYTLLDKGYMNTDRHGHSFLVREDGSGGRPTLEVVGFDFEYYTTNPGQARRAHDRLSEKAEDGTTARMHSYRIADKRPIMEAASYAMLERLGAKMPPVDAETDQPAS